MKKMILLLLGGLSIGLVLVLQPVHADENSGATSFWETLRSKLETLTPQKKLTATNASGGVRSAQVASEDMYWKGEVAQTIDVDELDAFKQALILADAGDKKQAQSAFSDFMKKFPNSMLFKEAEQALALSAH